jgi:hypothetical protein
MLSDLVLCVVGKLSTRRGPWAWFHDVWNCGAKKFLNIEEKLLTRRGPWAWFHDVWNCGAKVLEY